MWVRFDLENEFGFFVDLEEEHVRCLSICCYYCEMVDVAGLSMCLGKASDMGLQCLGLGVGGE